jgi:hypothetical protein
MNRILTLTILVGLMLLMTALPARAQEHESALQHKGSALQDAGTHWFDNALQERITSNPSRRISAGVLSFLGVNVEPYALSANPGTPEEFLWLGAHTRVNMFTPLTLQAELAYGAPDRQDITTPSTTALTFGLGYELNLFTPEVFMLYQNGDHSVKQNPHAGFGQSNPVLGSALSLELLPQELHLASMQGVGLRLRNISLTDNLTNYLSVVYATGIIDSPVLGSTFGPHDALLGVSMDTQYALFEHLAALMEIGVLKMYPGTGEVPDADWKLSLGFRLDF